MRLTEQQQQIIKHKVTDYFGNDAKVILFGSRTNDILRGGDIDLLIELQQPVDQLLKKNLSLNADLQLALWGLQKIDIITHQKNTPETPLYKEAQQHGIKL